ncbi:hypothetical protein CPB86DRAFT_877254 [Serendipita vermifera]|nr:hypothetical protein CPB86DRAFT_877254 [Serendipita vermifera]
MALTASRAKIQLSPSQQYETLARWVLDKRLRTLSWHTFQPILATTALLAIATQRTISFRILIAVPCFSVMMSLSFVILLVQQRKWDMQPIPDPKPSYRAQVSALLRQPSTYRTLAIGAGTFAAFALFNCLCAAFLGAAEWPLFAPTKRHTMNLNENTLFLILGNALLGVALSAMDLLTQRNVVKWPNKVSLKSTTLVDHATVFFKTPSPILVTVPTVTTFSIFYLFFRKMVYRSMLRTPLLGAIIKPFILHAARPSTSISILGYLYPRLLILGLVTMIQYENTQAFFDSLCGRGMLLSRDSPDPDACLRSGLEAPSDYYKHLAYLELSHIARKGPAARRVAIFNDPQKWNFISRSCFKILGQDYGLIKRRGKPAPARPAAPAPPTLTATPSTPRKSNITNLSSSVYKPMPPPSPGSQLLKSLLSASSSPATTVDAGTPPAHANGSPGEAKSPLKASVMPSVFVVKGPAENKDNQAAAAPGGAPPPTGDGPRKTLVGLIKDGIAFLFTQLTTRVPSLRQGDEPFVVLPQMALDVKRWFERERVGSIARGILKGETMDRLCVQILTGFTVASLTEDAYGTLQQDIPKVLECLTSTLLALEDYERELKTSHTELTDDMGEVNKAIFEVLTPLMDDIKVSLGEIITIFGDRLNVFRLPMPVARRLQLLVDVS